jgi:hypothetical protein
VRNLNAYNYTVTASDKGEFVEWTANANTVETLKKMRKSGSNI